MMRSSSSNDTQAFVLGAQRGRRRLDNAQSAPPALRGVSGGETILDWLLHALHDCGVERITYAGGYHIEKVITRFPNLAYRYVPNWATIGEIELAETVLADHLGGDVLFVRGDLVALPRAIERLLAASGELVVANYGRPHQFAGIVLVRESAIAGLKAALAASRHDPARANLAAAIQHQDAVPFSEIDLTDLAAPIDDQVAACRIVFAGKGRTLEQVRPLLKSATVLDLVRLRPARWHSDPSGCLAEIRRTLSVPLLIIRSSTVAEDGLVRSLAGHFLTVARVPSDDDAALVTAIDQVIASYSRGGRTPDDGDEVLVQPFISGLAASGVLLTRDADTAAPYFVINLDTTSGRADAVTSGTESKIETYYVAWSDDEVAINPAAAKTIPLARELMRITGLDTLDIEFALSAAGELFLLQVRPFALRHPMELSEDDLLDTIADARRFIRTIATTSPQLLGASPLLGTMTDWNPAEMIGLAPTALALSLYQWLIGDSSWAEARAAIGYRDVRPAPLIVSVGGIPYVDIRASLNSFLPAALDDSIARVWLDDCLGRLGRSPSLHDKVEFDVTLTCLDADAEAARRRTNDAGLGAREAAQFLDALGSLTNRIVRDESAPIATLLNTVFGLERIRRQARAAPAADATQAFAVARRLLDVCRTEGVVPFAILARYAFVALALLKSLRTVGALDDDDVELFLRSIPTVAGEFSGDMRDYARGALRRDDMLARYGHLRPNSYQITSPCYASAPDQFFVLPAGPPAAEPVGRPMNVLSRRASAVDRALKAAGLDFDHRRLGEFAMAAISARERAKFEFTKNLSLALEKIAEGGNILGLDRETLAHLPIEMLLRLATETSGRALASHLRRNASFNEKKWDITKALRMPDLITCESDVMAFQYPEGQPNFVTRRRVVAPAILIDAVAHDNLDGKIVMIQAADPGFDWIFAHRLAGLVTQFGGVASHMAIRAMEFDLPAAIGCGANLFNRLCRASTIDLDCANRRVAPVDQ